MVPFTDKVMELMQHVKDYIEVWCFGCEAVTAILEVCVVCVESA